MRRLQARATSTSVRSAGVRRAGAFALGLAVTVMCAIDETALAAGDKASASMIATNGNDVGSIDFEETLAGVLITVRLKAMPPGPHGFHILDIGRCEPPFTTAGKILNPLNAKHGLRHEEGPEMGNMPNLHAASNGEVIAEVLNPFVTLAPDADGSLVRESGTSIVVRANPDDHTTQPDGNSGAPIACGVIKQSK